MDTTRTPRKAIGFKFKGKEPMVQLRTLGFIYKLEGSKKISNS